MSNLQSVSRMTAAADGVDGGGEGLKSRFTTVVKEQLRDDMRSPVPSSSIGGKTMIHKKDHFL